LIIFNRRQKITHSWGNLWWCMMIDSLLIPPLRIVDIFFVKLSHKSLIIAYSMKFLFFELGRQVIRSFIKKVFHTLLLPCHKLSMQKLFCMQYITVLDPQSQNVEYGPTEQALCLLGMVNSKLDNSFIYDYFFWQS